MPVHGSIAPHATAPVARNASPTARTGAASAHDNPPVCNARGRSQMSRTRIKPASINKGQRSGVHPMLWWIRPRRRYQTAGMNSAIQ